MNRTKRRIFNTAIKIFAEKGYVREIQRNGNFLDRHIGRFEQRFGIHDDHLRDQVGHRLARLLFDRRAEVLGREAHLVRIERYPAFPGIMFHHQPQQFFAYLFAAAQPAVPVFAFRLFVHARYAVQQRFQYAPLYFRMGQHVAGEHSVQEREEVLVDAGGFGCQRQHGIFDHDRKKVHRRFEQVHLADETGRETHERKPEIGARIVELDHAARRHDDEVVFPDPALFQVDRGRQFAVRTEDEDAGFDLAGDVVPPQHLRGDVHPGEKIHGQVDVRQPVGGGVQVE